jgi:chemotaxis protein CheX
MLYNLKNSLYNMPMEIVSRQNILKYLQITLLSYSRICFFTSIKTPKTRIKTRLIHISSRGLQMRLEDLPKGGEGYLIFYSYTFIFRFRTRLRAGSDEGIYICDIPPMIETYDRRKYARLKFESRENKVVTVYNKALNKSVKAILSDISAGGLGFVVVDIEDAPKVDDIIMTEVHLKETHFQVMAQVIQVRDEFAGCVFLEKSTKFQLELNDMVKQEIDWRSEHMLKNLKKREELVKSFRKSKTPAAPSEPTIQDKLPNLEPFLEYFFNSFQAVTGILPANENTQHKESTALGSLSSLFFNVYFHSDPLFRAYLSAPQEVLHKMAKPVFGDNLSGQAINAGIVLEEMGKQLVNNSGRPGESTRIFSLTGAKVLTTDKRLLSNLLRQPSLRIHFETPHGDCALFLMAESLDDALNLCEKARAREFITMDKMDLIEPISYAALKVFSDYLKLDIREKSVTHREKLLPRFEISVLLDIFFDDIEGKVILNLSKRLAFKIYELLVDEKVDEFTSEVKDAVAEVTNMITGNAKSEFENHGIYYKIATPVVLESRQGVVIYAQGMKFLSSVYWTSEGFFDLSFSFFKK